MLRSEEWLRNQIGYVVGEKSDPSGEPLCVSPASSSLESGQPKAESRVGEPETESIGTTSNHPFWSVDRQEFVQAGSLEIGERLQTLSGDVKVVQQELLSLWPACDRATEARPEVSVSFLGAPRHIRRHRDDRIITSPQIPDDNLRRLR